MLQPRPPKKGACYFGDPRWANQENFKKKYTGGAWHAAVDFVNKALAMYRRYSYTH